MNKTLICPCCKKEVSISKKEYNTGYDYPKEKGFSEYDAMILINSRNGFEDIIDICPNCGYTMLYEDIPISNKTKTVLTSPDYRNILKSCMDESMKKWILLSYICMAGEEYSEAGVAYLKAYECQELKGLKTDISLLMNAYECFKKAAVKDEAFLDAIMGDDCMRRTGDFDKAMNSLMETKKFFSDELDADDEHLINMEWSYISIKVKEKRELDLIK